MAAIACVVYAFSLDRDVGFWDTGELQTVAYILGLAHPTGYPTEILMGWIFTHAFAFGEPALGMNFFCMLCVAVAVGCCCAIAQLFGARPLLAAGCALCFAFSPVVWAHSTHADVTDPALAFCALTVLATVFAIVRAAPRALYFAAVAAALALGTHGMVIWFLPLPLFLVLVSRKRELLRALPGCALLAFVLTAALYAYLPVRSAVVTAANLDATREIGMGVGMPFWDMGHPSTLKGFIDSVTGRRVGAATSLLAILEPARYGHDVAFAVDQLRGEDGRFLLWVMFALAFAGAWGSPRLLLLFLPVILVTPFAANFRNESDVSRYYTFPLLCLWALVALGLSRLVASRPRAAAGTTRIAAFTLAAIAAIDVYAGRTLFEQRRDALGSSYIARVLGATDADAILIADWVYATPLAYAELVRRSAARRIVVARPAEVLTWALPAWVKQRPVYAIAEAPPHVNVPVTFVRRLEVNPGPNDPKLYRLGGKP